MSSVILLGLIAMFAPALAEHKLSRTGAFFFILGLIATLCGIVLELQR